MVGYIAGDMCGRGVCMAEGGMCGREMGACVAGEMATVVDSTHPIGMNS